MCYDDKARPPIPPGKAGATRSEDLVLTAADSNQFAAYLATPEQTATANVVIYPDVRGLHHFYKELSVRFAEQGIAAIAIDYFGRTAGLTARDDAFEYMPHVQQLQFVSFLQDVDAAVARLRVDNEARPLFIVGFCMGGALSLLTATQDRGLAGVIPFYAGLVWNVAGGGAVVEQAKHIKYPVLALFGGADPGILPDQVQTFEQELVTAGVAHEVISYPGAPHSFFDRRAAEHAEASADAWTRVLGFIQAHS